MRTTSPPVLSIHNLSKIYPNGYCALQDFNLELGPGSILGLLGPNGAGKTTLIQMLLGVLEPTNGRIRIFDRNPMQDREGVAREMNFASSYALLPHSLRVRENLKIYALLYEVPDPERRIQEVLELMEIRSLQEEMTRHLSSGQMSRLQLAKALLNHPKLLLLDEPMASLDPDIADKTRRLLKETQNREGISILYTSHNMREIEQMCDRVIFLNAGRTVAQGTPQELLHLFQKESLEEVFLKIARQGP